MDRGRYRRSYDDGLVAIEERTAAAVHHYHHLRVGDCSEAAATGFV